MAILPSRKTKDTIAINDSEYDITELVLVEHCQNIVIYKNRIIFSLIDDNKGKEIYINEAIISNKGNKIKVNTSYTLFNQGNHIYKALISTFTVIGSYDPMGKPIKVSISDQAKLELLELLSDSKISQIRAVIEDKI